MSNIVFVCPQKFLSSDINWQSDVERTGYMPILKADVHNLQQSLQKVLDARNANKSNIIDSKLINNHKGIVQDSEAISRQDKSSKTSGTASNNNANNKYQSIKQFLPISLTQQLHTIAIRELPSHVLTESLERFILNSTKLAIEHISDVTVEVESAVESWTNISSGGMDKQGVFVRFKIDLETYPLIIETLENLLKMSKSSIGIHIDSNTKQFIDDKKVKLKNYKVSKIIDKDIEEFKKLEEDMLKNTQHESGHVYDETMEQYNIDLSTLSDIPRDLLDQLCKDIIDFRTKVVNIEKDRILKESYKENERQRHQMMRMFDQIRKNDSNVRESDDIIEDEDDEDEVDGNEDDSLVEERRIEKERLEADKRYKLLLKKLNTEIEPNLYSLNSMIEKQKNYESTLIKDRALYVKEVVNLGNDVYYDNHRAFKEDEEKRDYLDREQHGTNLSIIAEDRFTETLGNENIESIQDENAVEGTKEDTVSEVGQINIKFAFKKVIETSNTISDGESTESEEATIEPSITREIPLQANVTVSDILPFTQDELKIRLDKLRETRFVDELVKEYLGVYEEELVDYIFESLLENKSKNVLLDDLKETFDEDALIMVDRLWKREEFY